MPDKRDDDDAARVKDLRLIEEIAPYLDSLDAEIAARKMQGIKSINAASHYLLSRDGDIFKRTDKKELHDAKQEELYWLIVGSVHVAALKTIVKKTKGDPLCGSKAYATVMAAKTSAETDIVEETRAKHRELARRGIRSCTENNVTVP